MMISGSEGCRNGANFAWAGHFGSPEPLAEQVDYTKLTRLQRLAWQAGPE